jgi:hypothetical protein
MHRDDDETGVKLAPQLRQGGDTAWRRDAYTAAVDRPGDVRRLWKGYLIVYTKKGIRHVGSIACRGTTGKRALADNVSANRSCKATRLMV